MTVRSPVTTNALRSATVYALGGALPRVISLVTVPIFTRVVVPAEYGTFSLLVTIAGGVTILFSVGIESVFMRVYFQLAPDKRAQTNFTNTVWIGLATFPLIAGTSVGLVAWPLLPSHARFSGLELLLAFVGAAINVGANITPLSVLRAEQRLKAFIAFSLVATVSNAALTLLFIAVFRWGVLGWLVATILAYVIALVAGLLIVPFRRPESIDLGRIRELLALGAPLVPHTFSQWALQVADRVVIAGLVSASALGLYSLASNIGLPVLMLVQSVNYGFMPTYARAGTGDTTREELEETVVFHAATVAALTMLCALLGPPFLGVLAGPSYQAAAALVPWIVLGYGFYGLYCIPMNGIALAAGKTKFVPVVSLVAAAVNIGLLYLLVPSGGIHGAAVAAALAYAALLAAVFVYARRPENPVRYRWRALASIFALLLAAYVGARLTSSETGGAETIAIRILWAGAALLPLVVLRSRRRAAAGARTAA